MNVKLLNLHFSQLKKAWEKSKYNQYSDYKKNDYHSKLGELYTWLSADYVNEGLRNTDQESRQDIIDFFFYSLEYLDNSVIDNFPFELVYCLEEALKDWVENEHEYILCISLQNRMNHYAFEEKLTSGTNKIYRIIEDLTNGQIKFNRKLIQIELPKYLLKDYLANVSLYHELGHFINEHHRIAKRIYDDVFSKTDNLKNLNKLSSEELSIIYKYFEFVTEWEYHTTFKNIFIFHLGEYISDIFASQYIGENINKYLEYISKDKKKYHRLHPSTEKRKELVEKFLEGTHASENKLLELIISSVEKCTKNKLSCRYDKIKATDYKDFLDLMPVKIENDKQLHSVFILGWNVWISKSSEIKEKNKKTYNITDENLYDIINSLIEKSISNYIIEKNWNKAKSNVSE